MIYFIQEQDGEDKYIKIGFVEDLEGDMDDVNRLLAVETRIDCLQVGNARCLKILAVMTGTLDQEKMVQDRFQRVTRGRRERFAAGKERDVGRSSAREFQFPRPPRHESGEWFFPLPKLLDFIKLLPAYPDLSALSDEVGDLLLKDVASMSTHAQDAWEQSRLDAPPPPKRLR